MSLTLEQEEKVRFTLDTIAEHRAQLNDWERGFFDDQVKRFEEFGARMTLTPKQWAILDKMYQKATEL